jgi:hypothetical protein
MAIFEFYGNQFPVSGDSPFTGKVFADLAPDQQEAFLAYPVGVDIFTGADEQAIRQTFRRMNSYTVPLNAQEQRFATHQGRFKWFIYEQSELYSAMLKRLGVLSEKQIAAMHDGLLLTELAFALVLGIKTTNKRMLDRFYADRDEAFAEEEVVTEWLRAAFDLILQMPDIQDGTLMKPHQFYSLSLACAHAGATVPSLAAVYTFSGAFKANPSTAASSLGTLAASLDSDDPAEPLSEFVGASSKATNTAAHRSTRFKYCCLAIQGALPE